MLSSTFVHFTLESSTFSWTENNVNINKTITQFQPSSQQISLNLKICFGDLQIGKSKKAEANTNVTN